MKIDRILVAGINIDKDEIQNVNIHIIQHLNDT